MRLMKSRITNRRAKIVRRTAYALSALSFLGLLAISKPSKANIPRSNLPKAEHIIKATPNPKTKKLKRALEVMRYAKEMELNSQKMQDNALKLLRKAKQREANGQKMRDNALKILKMAKQKCSNLAKNIAIQANKIARNAVSSAKKALLVGKDSIKLNKKFNTILSKYKEKLKKEAMKLINKTKTAAGEFKKHVDNKVNLHFILSLISIIIAAGIALIYYRKSRKLEKELEKYKPKEKPGN